MVEMATDARETFEIDLPESLLEKAFDLFDLVQRGSFVGDHGFYFFLTTTDCATRAYPMGGDDVNLGPRLCFHPDCSHRGEDLLPYAIPNQSVEKAVLTPVKKKSRCQARDKPILRLRSGQAVEAYVPRARPPSAPVQTPARGAA